MPRLHHCGVTKPTWQRPGRVAKRACIPTHRNVAHKRWTETVFSAMRYSSGHAFRKPLLRGGGQELTVALLREIGHAIHIVVLNLRFLDSHVSPQCCVDE